MGRHNVFVQRRPPDIVGASPCVFVSHRPFEKPLARSLAAYLDVLALPHYFDELDIVLAASMGSGRCHEEAVVETIERGLSCCSHLLGLVGPETVRSWWLPYEIAAARAHGGEAAYVVVGDIADMPGYLNAAVMLRTEEDLSAWCEGLAGWPTLALATHFREAYDEMRDQVSSCGVDVDGDGWLDEMRDVFQEQEPLLHHARNLALADLSVWFRPRTTGIELDVAS